MSEKRFTFEYDDGQWGVPLFYDDGKKLCFDDVVRLLNEQQAIIQELERKLKKYAKIGEEQLKQIIELQEENEQLKNYFKKRAECSNFQINKLKEEIAELQEDNVDTIVELSKENEQLAEENKQLHYKIIELQDKLGMSEKVIDDE